MRTKCLEIQRTKFLFLGDFLYDHDEILQDIETLGEYIQERGYAVILNLEAPMRSNTPKKKWINLHQTELIADVLKLLNVVAVNIANNHIMDWGEKGLGRLLQMLDERGIAHFGAGKTFVEATAPAIIKTDNRTVGLIGYGWEEEMCVCAARNRPGVAPLKEGLISRSIDQLRKQVDILIVNLHWGYEYEQYPLPLHRQLAHRLIEHGADLIIGHHPHIVQPFEVYQEKPIYYSLGNFYFGSLRQRYASVVTDEETKYLSGYGLGVVFDTHTRSTKRIFFKSRDWHTHICSAPDILGIKDLSSISMADYSRSYPTLRTSSRKPTLYSGTKHHLLLNPAKLKLAYFKDTVNKRLGPALKKLGIYDTLRRQWIRLRKEW